MTALEFHHSDPKHIRMPLCLQRFPLLLVALIDLPQRRSTAQPDIPVRIAPLQFFQRSHNILQRLLGLGVFRTA
jgi:hypothetical protein